MFNNIGGKIKSLAKAECWIGIICSLTVAIVLWNSGVGMGPEIGLIVLIIGGLLSWIGCWLLYAVGEITEDIHAMRLQTEATVSRPKYVAAMEQMKQKNFDKAAKQFAEIAGYEDAAEMVSECRYQKAQALMQQGKYPEAIKEFENIDEYKDAETLTKQCWYAKADASYREHHYDEAWDAYYKADDYSDASDKLIEVRYEQAAGFIRHKQFREAYDILNEMKYYRDAEQLIETTPELAQIRIENADASEEEHQEED